MIVVIGAGPAGLSAAYHLGDVPHIVVEREATPGGLCRSFQVDGATFDFGGHAFFTRHEYVRRLLTDLCAVGLHTQPRRAWIRSHGSFVPYPFQSRLHGLPDEVVEDCLVGLYEAARQQVTGPASTLAEWIDRSFGPGIARHFLTPYNEKLWAFPLAEISPEWSSDRIVTPNVRAIVAGALRAVDFTDFPNATVSYPASGGFYDLYRGLADAVSGRIRRGTVTGIVPRTHTLTTADGHTTSYDAIVSTMPLDRLVRVTDGLGDCCRQAAATLRHNSLHLVNLAVAGSGFTDMHRVYSADPEVPFHKLVLNSNSSPELRAAPRFGIQAEVSWSPHKRVDVDGLDRRVINSITEMEIIRPADRITASTITQVPYAYPVYSAETAVAREHLLTELREFDILCAGRFGEWLYINSDDAVLRGKARAEELVGTAHPAGPATGQLVGSLSKRPRTEV